MTPWSNFGGRRTVRLHPHRVDDGVGPTSGCLVTDERTEVVLVLPEVDDFDSPVSGALQPFGDEIDRNDPGAMMLSNPGCHVADRAEPEHDDGSPLRNGGVLDGLPRRRQDIREVDETVVGRTRLAP